MSILSIGHGNRTKEQFIELLKKFDVSFLIDVRSSPFSKFAGQFNQPELESYLKTASIRYVFMGDQLGGRPKDKSCYDSKGKVEYATIHNKEFYKIGIDRLKHANSQDFTIAIMCSELRPSECHRSKLIGRSLMSEGISIHHIDEYGKIKDQTVVINEVNKGVSEINLFGELVELTSRKVYDIKP